MSRRGKITFLATAWVALAIIVTACGNSPQVLSPMMETLTPMSASVRGTLTARAGQVDNNGDLSTAVAGATAEAQVVYATQTAAGDISSPSTVATATAIAPVMAELPRYGIDPSEGYVAWLHPPVTIHLQGSQQTGYANDFQNVTAADFVMAADITWHTENSTSRCGFMFRSNGDTNQPSQYTVVITRVASGHLAFLSTVNGKITNFQSFYPEDKDKSFNWFNDSTNRLAIVVRGKLVDMYTNGQLIGEVDVTQPPSTAIAPPPAPQLPANATSTQVQDYNNQLSQMGSGMNILNGEMAQAQTNFSSSNSILTDGFLGFVGLSQSGTTDCKFENGWLFNLVK